MARSSLVSQPDAAPQRDGQPALAEEVAQHLGQPLCKVTIKRFADGELFVKIDENVRGRDVYIIQPTNPPAETCWSCCS